MLIYNHSFNKDSMLYPNNCWAFYPYDTFSEEEICYFDIETTGLSADTSGLYLIGLGYFEENEFKVIQWFADDYVSEKDLIEAFFSELKRFKILLHYNGSTFDIPYINNKCKQLNINPSPINEIKNLDLYFSLRKYSQMLGLPNKKLKSFEAYIGLNRDDMYNGGELIEVYKKYIHNKYLRIENDDLLELLLLHNYEDITGLPQVASLLFLKNLKDLKTDYESCSVTENEDGSFLNIIYRCMLPGEFNFTMNIPCDDMSVIINYSKDYISLTTPIIKQELKYYFPDYKDYYYMINEDCVMHKSVAIYADSSVRRKAKKNQCFTLHYGSYIPMLKTGNLPSEIKLFKKENLSSESYVLLTDDMLKDSEFLNSYYFQMIK